MMFQEMVSVTTEEELHAYGIIRAICCREVPFEDIYLRDAKTYCAILYQDNNRKPIVRLFFDRKVPRIIIFDPERKEQIFDIERVDDIYRYAEQLCARVRALKAA